MNTSIIYVLLSRGFDPWVAAAFRSHDEAYEFREANDDLKHCFIDEVEFHDSTCSPQG